MIRVRVVDKSQNLFERLQNEGVEYKDHREQDVADLDVAVVEPYGLDIPELYVPLSPYNSSCKGCSSEEHWCRVNVYASAVQQNTKTIPKT